MNEKPWLTQVLEWLERVLPGLIGAFGLGYKVGQSGTQKVKNDLSRTELAKEEVENELQNEKDFEHKSDADTIRDAVKGSGAKPDSDGSK